MLDVFVYFLATLPWLLCDPPAAMELARHYPPPHPLTQTYRPGILSGPPTAGPYMPPPSPYISVRIDPTGMPFVDWGMVRITNKILEVF